MKNTTHLRIPRRGSCSDAIRRLSSLLKVSLFSFSNAYELLKGWLSLGVVCLIFFLWSVSLCLKGGMLMKIV
jgi:hypothetical protein